MVAHVGGARSCTRSQDPVVICGDKWVYWAQFQAFAMGLLSSEEIGRPTGLGKEAWEDVWNTVSARQLSSVLRMNAESELGLQQLLAITQARHASDARDHVLVILGLISKSAISAELHAAFGKAT